MNLGKSEIYNKTGKTIYGSCNLILVPNENEVYSVFDRLSIQYVMYGEKNKLYEMLNELVLLKCVS